MRLADKSAGYLTFLEEWMASRPTLKASELFEQPTNATIFCVDVIKGFCCEGAGPLASARVGTIVPPIKELLEAAWDYGVQRFIFPQDNHPSDSLEFKSFPPHCIAGTDEAKTVDELLALPFANNFQRWPKKVVNTGVEHIYRIETLIKFYDTNIAVITGDCTDLCVYTLANSVKQAAIVANRDIRVIVPMNCVQTYDLPLDVATQIGAEPHPGDLWHALALHHMQLNGIEVVKAIQ